MINLDLFTNDIKIIQKIKKPFKINRIFSEEKNLLRSKKNLLNKFIHVKNRENILRKINLKSELAISYGFGVIFNKKIISKYSMGIWNIHTGDLPKYRGRHPITAAFLNDEKKIGTTIHSIDNRIDRGFLLSKAFVKRNYSDDENSIKKKILKIIPNLLSKSFKNYQNKSYKKIAVGKYYKPFYNGINLKNSKKYSYIYIFNAIKAQKIHGGIFVNGEKFSDVKFYRKNFVSNSTSKVIICKNFKKLIVKK